MLVNVICIPKKHNFLIVLCDIFMHCGSPTFLHIGDTESSDVLILGLCIHDEQQQHANMNATVSHSHCQIFFNPPGCRLRGERIHWLK